MPAAIPNLYRQDPDNPTVTLITISRMDGTVLEGKIDTSDIQLISKYQWCIQPTHRSFYILTHVERDNKKTKTRMHQILLPGAEAIDHINGDGLDNRRSNLRSCTQAQNKRNRRLNQNNTSSYKGVSWSRQNNKWKSAIKVNGKEHYLGYFDTAEAAYEAYCKAAKELHGEFANFGAHHVRRR